MARYAVHLRLAGRHESDPRRYATLAEANRAAEAAFSGRAPAAGVRSRYATAAAGPLTLGTDDGELVVWVEEVGPGA